MRNLGDKLQNLRRQKGLSQEKLAEALGVSRQAVSKWELCDAVPDVENLLRLSELLGVSTDYLLRDDIADAARPEASPKQPAPKQRSRARSIAGWVCLGLGLLGEVVIYVLSTMIRVPVPNVVAGPDGMVTYHWQGQVAYSYKYFVQEYRLKAILVILGLLIAAGLALILWQRKDRLLSRLRGAKQEDMPA